MLECLIKAKERRETDHPIVIQSDRGVQYTSELYQRLTKGMVTSYSWKGTPWDNACTESFHSLIKREWLQFYKIDNYYATPDRERGNQLLKLLKSVIKESGDETSPLRATVQKRDAGIFKYMNFITIRETKLYVMMELVRMGSDSGQQDG